ncbi:MAG: hypothetical protein ABI778_03625 [Ignavibacteriota bacterium]
MKHSLLSLFLFCALILSAESLFAQSGGDVLNPDEGGGFLIGPIAGINLVSYKTDEFAILNSEPTCFTAQNGSDIAPFFGLTAMIPLGSEMQNFIILQAIYDSKSSKFTTTNGSRTSIPTKINGNVADGSVTTSETATLTYLLVDVGYKYNFTQGPSPVGPALQLTINTGFRLSSTLNKTVTVTAASPQGAPGSGQTLSNTQTNAVEALGATAIRIGIRAQFMYDIPLSPSWILSPLVGYDLPFTKVADSNMNWSASAAYAGVALHYFIGK